MQDWNYQDGTWSSEMEGDVASTPKQPHFFIRHQDCNLIEVHEVSNMK